MASNKVNKVEALHKQMPSIFRTRTNPNWKALIEALGESDQKLADLIEEVRQQMFIKTASRPYLDRLASNFNVSRPRLIGMSDEDFRRYIPVLAYQPKQVKYILDQLIDVFFFKETTTAFVETGAAEPYDIEDKWDLIYRVDDINEETITFRSDDFVDPNNAKAEEVASVINRNAKYSFAVVFDDRIKKQKFVRIFSRTIGSKGSIEMRGGLANISLQFTGYNTVAGAGVSTVWTVTKVGDTVTFKHTGGATPRIDKIQAGDVALIDITGNVGSFVIESVNISDSSFTITNLFGTAGVFDHSLNPTYKLNFLRPEKAVVYTRANRAVVWEVSPGEIIVEMPASPPIVKRRLEGSAHINGMVESVVNRVSDTELEISDASEWPQSGKFVLQEKTSIKKHILTPIEDFIDEDQQESRFDKQRLFSYTGKSGNNLTGISPNLPELSAVHEVDVLTAVRDNSHTVTVTTATAHNFKVGDTVAVQNVKSALSTKGIRVDVSVSDTPSDVASKVAAVISSLTDFTATASVDVVQITNASNGTATDAADIDSGVSITIAQQGSATQPEITQVQQLAGSAFDVAGNGLRWEISSANDATRYHVWYNVTDGTNSQINAGLDAPVDGTFTITEVPSTTSFRYVSAGESGNGVDGLARVERSGLADSGSLVYLTTARLETGIYGPYIWDPNAAFVLSSFTAKMQDNIKSGNNVRTLQIETPNNIPDEEGFVIFNFGTEKQEGPVRYFYKPSDGALQLDPAYVFENNHDAGDFITVIRRRGAHVISTTGKEYAPYVTDPAVARDVLKELIRQSKSVGIFINFLIRYPQQLYGVLDVYKSGNPDLQPVGTP